MPIVQIDVTKVAVSVEAKRKLVAKVTKAVDEAYPLPVQSTKRPELGGRGPDTRIFIREYAGENLGYDGRLQIEPEPIRPVLHIDAPPGITLEGKRKMFAEVTEAVVEAYKAVPNDVVLFLRQHDIANVGANGRPQSDNQLEHPRKWCLRLRGREAGVDDKKFGFDEGVPARRNT
jgi:phenylpyruvate tautomerase PptA (4-oxalocrotonate tautomerase family)